MAEFLIADLKCPTCGREFEDKAVFRAHMEFHARKKPFKCSECNYSSESQHRLDQHMHKVSSNFALLISPPQALVCKLRNVLKLFNPTNLMKMT